MPGSRPTGQRHELLTKDNWDSYIWNPPQYYGKTKIDALASPKPSWEELHGYATLLERQDRVKALLLWTRLEICIHIYKAVDLIDELQNHQQGNYTEAQNDKRDAVRTVYRAQRDLINAATLDTIDAVYEQAQTAISDAID